MTRPRASRTSIWAKAGGEEEEDDTFLVEEEEDGDNVSGLLDGTPGGKAEDEEP